MLKYAIKIEGEKRPLPVVTFADEAYALAGTFLVAEARSFGREILAALDRVCVEGAPSAGFSGNALSLAITPDMTTITDDIMGDECEIPTKEFRAATEAYLNVCEKCRKGTAE